VPIAPLRRLLQARLLVRQKLGKVKFCGPLLTLRLENDESGSVPSPTVRVLPRNMLLHPLTESIVNVDFVLAPVDERVRVRVPVRILNAERCPGLRSGGWTNLMLRAVDISVEPGASAPFFVTVDIAGMELKDRKRVKDLDFSGKGEGCRTILPDEDLAIVISKV
jgi:Ribosomal protein TL5, C-terminal domain